MAPLPSMVACAFPVTKPSCERRRRHVGHGVDGHPRQRRAQMPAIVGIRGLSDVRDRQWVGRSHPITQTEKNDNNCASTKKFDHEHPPDVKQSTSLVTKPDTARDPRGRC
jgi:hypothetical protein